jgi:hypothetical protein
MFKDGGTDIHDEERSGRPFIVSDDLVQSVGQKICERQCITISELSCEFPQISHTVLYDITVRLGCHKFLHKMGSRNAHRFAQNTENGFGFDFF